MIYRKDYRAPDFLLERTDLDVQIGTTTCVVARLKLRRSADADANAPLVLNGRHLTLVELQLEGKSVGKDDYQLGEESLTLPRVPERFELSVTTEVDPESNTALEGWYRSGPMLCTQCEPQGFSRITYSLDRPDVLSTYRVRMEADEAQYPVLLANGDCVESGTLGEGRHYAVWEDPHPKPSYLFAMVAGDLAKVEGEHITISGRRVAIHFFVDHGNENRVPHAMVSLQKAMCWDEATYGLEYDLDTYMVVAARDFNMGAMENKGLNLFNARFVLASPETATDDDYDGIESVIAHEYFHNWTGNRVTCRDWFQLSLKEGLTVFRDQCFSGDQGSPDVTRISQVRMLRAMQFPEDAGPTSHPVRPDSYSEVNNLYTATVYEKGAEILRMLYGLIGEQAFIKGVEDYLKTHDGSAATVEDLVAALERSGGRSLDDFRLWYSQSGTPQVTVEGHYDGVAKTYTLSFSQHTPPTQDQDKKQALPIPIALGLRNDDGIALERTDDAGKMLRDDLFLLEEERAELVFSDIQSAPVPAFLHGFSAPVKLEYAYVPEDLSLIVLNEPDGFVRWQAAQTLVHKALSESMSTAGSDGPFNRMLLRAFQALAANPPADNALTAELLSLPSHFELSSQIAPLDPLKLAVARAALRQNIAQALTGPLSVWSQWDPAELTPENKGRRRLSNLALWYLAGLGIERVRDMALSRSSSNNMTLAMGGLNALRDQASPQRDQAMDDFHSRFAGDGLVLDKWFALEAGAELPRPLTRIQALLAHSDYVPNPNRVRSVLGGFMRENPLGFHAADASGYALLADQIAALDGSNPQLAARLVDGLLIFGRLAAPFADNMKAVVAELSGRVRSRDVREKIDKALADRKPPVSR